MGLPCGRPRNGRPAWDSAVATETAPGVLCHGVGQADGGRELEEKRFKRHPGPSKSNGYEKLYCSWQVVLACVLVFVLGSVHF